MVFMVNLIPWNKINLNLDLVHLVAKFVVWRWIQFESTPWNNWKVLLWRFGTELMSVLVDDVVCDCFDKLFSFSPKWLAVPIVFILNACIMQKYFYKVYQCFQIFLDFARYFRTFTGPSIWFTRTLCHTFSKSARLLRHIWWTWAVLVYIVATPPPPPPVSFLQELVVSKVCTQYSCW